MLNQQRRLILLLTCITLLSGLANLFAAAHPQPALVAYTAQPFLRNWLPLEFLHYPRSLTLLTGFALVISAVNIYKRKRRAWQIVMALSAGSTLLHLWRDHLWQGFFSLALVTGLLYARRDFTVASRGVNFRVAALRMFVALLAALAYGVAGFWLLEIHEFGVNFNWLAALKRTLQMLLFINDATLVPRTHHAAWFLDSLEILSLLLVGYGLFALFRPMLYRLHTLPHERARMLLQHYGRNALDNFKLWPDKSYFFNPTQDCFIAYRVAAHTALTLGDPIGPPDQLAATIRAFKRYCENQGWAIAWHQTLPDCLPLYQQAGFKKLKIGDDAIVDLTQFTLAGTRFKRFRQRAGQLEKQGVTFRHYAAPLPDELIERLREVSDEWLQVPGKRERAFTLGRFAPAYLRTTEVFTAEDQNGRVLAFVNLLPSYHTGEATIDLMRHRLQPPNGIMDYLFVKLFGWCQAHGYTRFNLGMAPMAGFAERETASAAEKAVHAFFQRLNFLFSFSGIKQYKAKFADTWEPRYLIYRNIFDLPKIGLALGQITELKEHEPLPLFHVTPWREPEPEGADFHFTATPAAS